MLCVSGADGWNLTHSMQSMDSMLNCVFPGAVMPSLLNHKTKTLPFQCFSFEYFSWDTSAKSNGLCCSNNDYEWISTVPNQRNGPRR